MQVVDMTDVAYKEMTLAHDKHIDSLTTSIEVLADNVEHSNTTLNESIKETNQKLDTVIDVMSKQNVIAERLDNMDINIKEFAQRTGKRISIIENSQNLEGCPMLRIANERTDAIHTELLSVKTIVDKHEDLAKSTISSTAIRWVVIIILGYAVTFGSYIVMSLHDVDTTTKTLRVQEQVDKTNIERRIEQLENTHEQHYYTTPRTDR